MSVNGKRNVMLPRPDKSPAKESGSMIAQRSETTASVGASISLEFIESVLLPVLKESCPDDFDRLAVAVVGTGSDVLGLDDEISRDHHWGPRANVLYLRQDAGRLKKSLTSGVRRKAAAAVSRFRSARQHREPDRRVLQRGRRFLRAISANGPAARHAIWTGSIYARWICSTSRPGRSSSTVPAS